MNEIEAFNELQHISPIRFSTDVLQFVENNADITYIEAISHFCQKYDIELEGIKSFIIPDLYEKLLDEGQSYHTVKKFGRIKI